MPWREGFAAALLSACPIHGVGHHPVVTKGSLLLGTDETPFELLELSLASFFFFSFFFFLVGFCFLPKNKKDKFPCRPSLHRTRTPLTYLHTAPIQRDLPAASEGAVLLVAAWCCGIPSALPCREIEPGTETCLRWFAHPNICT